MKKRILIIGLMFIAAQLVSGFICWLLFQQIFFVATFIGTLPIVLIFLFQSRILKR